MGISKKTLDDYLMYLKKGLSVKFDFKSHLNINFGHLRYYIADNFKEIDKKEMK